jgi:hypothetical protein
MNYTLKGTKFQISSRSFLFCHLNSLSGAHYYRGRKMSGLKTSGLVPQWNPMQWGVRRGAPRAFTVTCSSTTISRVGYNEPGCLLLFLQPPGFIDHACIIAYNLQNAKYSAQNVIDRANTNPWTLIEEEEDNCQWSIVNG